MKEGGITLAEPELAEPEPAEPKLDLEVLELVLEVLELVLEVLELDLEVLELVLEVLELVNPEDVGLSLAKAELSTDLEAGREESSTL